LSWYKVESQTHDSSQILPFGNFYAQSSHLITLHSSFRKEQHYLHLKDLDHQDKQNFEAVTRLTSSNIISFLDEFQMLLAPSTICL